MKESGLSVIVLQFFSFFQTYICKAMYYNGNENQFSGFTEVGPRKCRNLWHILDLFRHSVCSFGVPPSFFCSAETMDFNALEAFIMERLKDTLGALEL